MGDAGCIIADIRRYLEAKGQRLLSREVPLYAVNVRRWQTVYEAELHFADSIERVVVKCIDECALNDAASLMRVQRCSAAIVSDARAALVPILSIEAARNWIVMPRVPGVPLESLAKSALDRRSHDADRVEAALRRVAHLLAGLHRVDGRIIDAGIKITPNRDYLRSIKQAWRHPLVRRATGGEPAASALFRRVCSDAFRKRIGDRLLPGDVQPKNIVLEADGRPTLIDPDYGCGNPALTLCHMLVSLDRLTLRRPGRSAVRTIDGWKRAFIDAYVAEGDAAAVADIPALYPWMLVRSYDLHVRERRWATSYLARGYARMLRRFIAVWLSPSARQAPVATDATADPPLRCAA